MLYSDIYTSCSNHAYSYIHMYKLFASYIHLYGCIYICIYPLSYAYALSLYNICIMHRPIIVARSLMQV